MSSSAFLAYAAIPQEVLRPPGKTPPEELIAFVRSRAYSGSRVYAEDYSRARKAELYDQSEQWIRQAKSSSDTVYAMHWSKMTPSDDLPLPVYNEGVLLRENESARLGRPEYKPRVRTKSSNAGIKEKEGALGAERALQSRVREMWASQEDLFFLHPPLYGGVWVESRWDQTWLDTVRVPAPMMCCPRHPKSGITGEARTGPPMLAKGTVDAALSGGEGALAALAGEGELADTLQHEVGEGALEGAEMQAEAVGGMGMGPAPTPTPMSCSYCRRAEKSELSPEQSGMPSSSPLDTASGALSAPADGGACPQCPDHPRLVPFSPTLDEALKSPEMGMDQPKGDWFMSVRSPYHIFPRDAGIAIDNTDVPEWVYVHMETLEWAEQRWPDKVRDLATGALRIHPENPAALIASNPSLGTPDILRHASTLGVFRSHVVVYEYNRKPWLEWDEERKRYAKNRGRHVVTIGSVVCLDDHLLVESLNRKGEFVPRIRIEYVPWEFMDGGRRSTVGQSLWDRIFDAQDGENERVGQIRAVNARGALPWYLQDRGMNFETKSADSAVPFRRVLADLDPTSQKDPLRLMQNTTIDAGVYNELQFTTTYMQRHVTEVEKGQAPPGVSAATAIAYLKTESGEKRRPRIKRLRECLVRNWRHGVELMSAFYIEERPYSYEDESGDERHAFIHGDVIASANPKVDIYPTPDYDAKDARRENIRDMVQMGILDPRKTPQLNRKIVKAMDEESEFFVDDDLQEQQAQREWQYFKDSQRVPVIDPSLDDHTTHFLEHGKECFSEWFRDQEDQARWDEALKVLEGDWENDLQQIAQILVMPAPPPVPGVQIPPKPCAQDAILNKWTQKLQLAEIQKTPGAMEAMQQAAQAAAMGQGQMPPMPELPAPLKLVLQWRAHIEAHRLTVQMTQLRQQMMSAAPVAPGGGSAPVSTEEQQVQETV